MACSSRSVTSPTAVARAWVGGCASVGMQGEACGGPDMRPRVSTHAQQARVGHALASAPHRLKRLVGVLDHARLVKKVLDPDWKRIPHLGSCNHLPFCLLRFCTRRRVGGIAGVTPSGTRTMRQAPPPAPYQSRHHLRLRTCSRCRTGQGSRIAQVHIDRTPCLRFCRYRMAGICAPRQNGTKERGRARVSVDMAAGSNAAGRRATC